MATGGKVFHNYVLKIISEKKLIKKSKQLLVTMVFRDLQELVKYFNAIVLMSITLLKNFTKNNEIKFQKI